MRSPVPIAAVAAVAVALLGVANAGLAADAPTNHSIPGVQSMVGSTAPDFTLDDQNGTPFGMSAQRGHVAVLYFGYTHCPDVCPTTLALIASIIRQIGPDADRDIRVAFITDDPGRDTPATLRRYVTLFDPKFLGLSGTNAQLTTVYSAYHVWFTQLPNSGSAAGYLLAHSSFIYIIDKGGVVRSVHDWRDDRSSIERDLKKVYP